MGISEPFTYMGVTYRSSTDPRSSHLINNDMICEAYHEFFVASTSGPEHPPLSRSTSTLPIQAWQTSLDTMLPKEIRLRILSCLATDFAAHQSEQARLIRFMTEVVRQLRHNPRGSINFIERKLREKRVMKEVVEGDKQAESWTACVFAVVGWATRLYKPDPQEELPLAIDTQHAPCFSAPNIPKSFASRSVAEIVDNMGDILPVPAPTSTPRGYTILAPGNGDSESSTVLYVASLNFHTLSQLGSIRIAWVDTVTAHLNFDITNLTLFLFRFPSFCQLHATRHSIVAPILSSHSSSSAFTFQRMMEEILLSYSLIFRLHRRAQQRYQKEKANPSNQLTDPLLDELCLGQPIPATTVHSSLSSIFSRKPQKESFEAISEFPIFSGRLLRLQRYMDGIPTNHISNLWKDRRDMSKWYTFWAVIWLGGASLIVGVVQTALAAESVRLAREQLKASSAT
ncbi:hypothetical protein F5884DRAFT_856290 [Xylogone sp. PMI_703]|nr:hypothetical protein F5884DRAFT_856290 [Xylogone sp. PMI_703]